ncbi:hypothetical protein L873DRAFT_1822020, partial [Choiromyces venosus 120613-1]
MSQANEAKNIVVLHSAYLAILPHHLNCLIGTISSKGYQIAKNLYILHQIVNLIRPGCHTHYMGVLEFDDNRSPKNYSVKLYCTGDGTYWYIVMGPVGVKGM